MDLVSEYDSLHDGFASSPLAGTIDSLTSRKASALSSKLANVLSFSYTDAETREALRLLDLRKDQTQQSVRSNLKSNVQKEVIDANGRVVDDFGEVAEVRLLDPSQQAH